MLQVGRDVACTPVARRGPKNVDNLAEVVLISWGDGFWQQRHTPDPTPYTDRMAFSLCLPSLCLPHQRVLHQYGYINVRADCYCSLFGGKINYPFMSQSCWVLHEANEKKSEKESKARLSQKLAGKKRVFSCKQRHRIGIRTAGEMQRWKTYYTQTLSPLEPFSPSSPGSPCRREKIELLAASPEEPECA